MRKLVITTVLLVLLGGLPAYALQEPEQDKEKDKPKPAQQQEPRKQETEKQKSQPQERERQQPDRQQEKQQNDLKKREKEQPDRAAQTDRQSQQTEKDRAKQDKAAQEHAQQIQRDHRDQRDQHNNVQQTQRDGGNRNARRIRDEDFRSQFGHEHHFRVERRDDRRFNYGGYWFQFSDPWPSQWSYDDDVYVDDIDGEYYLIDPVHPGFRILVVVAD